MPGNKDTHYYKTTDHQNLAAVLKWSEGRKEWNERVRKLGDKIGRKPGVQLGFWGESKLVAFTVKPGDPMSWTKTNWVYAGNGMVRPRLTTPEGRKLLAEMEAVGECPHVTKTLKGVPAIDPFRTGYPGYVLSKDEKTFVISFSSEQKLGPEWTEIKASEYFRIAEEREEAEAATQ